MGVLRSFSFCLRKPGEPAKGLRISDGNPPDAGVCKQDAALGRLSKPAAAMVAVAVAEAMVGVPSWDAKERRRRQTSVSATATP